MKLSATAKEAVAKSRAGQKNPVSNSREMPTATVTFLKRSQTWGRADAHCW
jgi:hypothetical protein